LALLHRRPVEVAETLLAVAVLDLVNLVELTEAEEEAAIVWASDTEVTVCAAVAVVTVEVVL
jgi:hypothetical protein